MSEKTPKLWGRYYARPLACLSHLIFKALAERRFARQLSTRPIFGPHSGHRTRYNSTTTVVRNLNTGRSRTSRSQISWMPSTRRPQPEQINFSLFPRLCRTQSFSVFACSSVSCRHTRYPGQSSSFVRSASLKLSSVRETGVSEPRASNRHLVGFLLRGGYEWPHNADLFHQIDKDSNSVPSPDELRNFIGNHSATRPKRQGPAQCRRMAGRLSAI